MSLDKRFQKQSWYHHLPSADLDVSEEHLNQFFEYMYERQEIWHKRFLLKQPAPWTTYPILRDYKFTNVYRELDRSTQYLIKNVYLKETDLKQIVFSIFAHRIYNNPNTFAAIGYPDVYNYDEAEWLRKLEDLENNGQRTLNQEAYKINTYIWVGEPRWQAYTTYILGELLKIIDDVIDLVLSGTAEETIAKLRAIKGVGIFLAHEYYQDFCDLNRYFKKGLTEFDKDSWTNVGPGCSTGLRIIFPSCKTLKEQEEKLYLLRDISSDYLAQFGEFKYLNWDNKKQEYFVTPGQGSLDVHVQEMWTCEFSKIWKMQIGLGKQRSKFVIRTK
jgi:hypothetical protein